MLALAYDKHYGIFLFYFFLGTFYNDIVVQNMMSLSMKLSAMSRALGRHLDYERISMERIYNPIHTKAII